MSGLPLPEPVADEDDDGLQDRAALLTPSRPRPGRRRPRTRPRTHAAAGRCLPLIKTLTICLAFFTLGLCIALPGPTLLDLQSQVGVSLSQISQLFFWRALGYLAGSMISGLLFDKLNRLLMMLASMALAAAGMATVPWLSTALSLNVCFCALGVPLGFVDTGGNVLLLDLWGKSSGPYMQAIHFSFGLGAFAAPLLAVPFIAHAPAVNGSTPVLFGRNHLHTAHIPEHMMDDLPDSVVNSPAAQDAMEDDMLTPTPPGGEGHRSSVKRAGVEAPPFRLGVALAGGDASTLLPRSARFRREAETKAEAAVKSRKGADADERPVTVQGRDRETVAAVTETRKSAVGTDGVVLDGATGYASSSGGLETGVRGAGTEQASPAIPAAETAMRNGEGAASGGAAVAEVSVVPSTAAVDNSSVAAPPTDGAQTTSVASQSVENESSVILNTTSSQETHFNLSSNTTDATAEPGSAQNVSEGAMLDVATSGNLNLTEPPTDVTTVGSALNTSEPTGEPALAHTPKPKPSFTDGNKLEHDQTWVRPALKQPALKPAPAPAADPATPDASSESPTQPTNTTEESPSSTAQTDNTTDTATAPTAGSEGEAMSTAAPLVSGSGGREHGAPEESENTDQQTQDVPVTAAPDSDNGTMAPPSVITDSVAAAAAAAAAVTPGESEDIATTTESKPHTDPQSVADNTDPTVTSHTNVAPDPSSVSNPVSKSVYGTSVKGPTLLPHGPLATEPPATDVDNSNIFVPNTDSPDVVPSDPDAHSTVAGSGRTDEVKANGTPSSSVADASVAADAGANDDGPVSEPIPAEVRPAPSFGSSGPPDDDGDDDEGDDWDPERPAGTEPGLSVPAVPPTAAAPATSPVVPAGGPAPTSSQAGGRVGTEQDGAASPGSIEDSGRANSAPQPAGGVESDAGSADSSSPSPPPPPRSPKPHKPGTYDDTSAEDGLLTRLSSAAAVRGVPPLAQLYLLVSCSLLIVALIFLALLVYDPRARRAVPGADTGVGPSRCYTAALVTIMAIVLCFYVGMEVAMGQLLMSFSVHSRVHLTRAGGAYVTSVFWGLFAAGRALSVCVAGVLRPAAVLAVNYALVTAGAVVLVVAGSWDRTALLVGGALAGLGMSSVYPAALVWLEQHVHVSSRMAACLVVAGALGEMLLPAGVGALMAVEPRALTISLAVCTGVCLLMQFAAVLVARLGRPAVGPLEGYQLAAQEEEEDMVDLGKYPGGGGEDGSRRLLRM